MKQFFLFLLSGLCVNIYATVRTVSNTPGTVAQFTTVQAAADASINGDTIYIHGSNTQYAGFTVTDKRLTYIGPGWSPLGTFNPLKATVSGITLKGTGCDNSEVHGLVVTGVINCGFNHPNNIRFIRNQFLSTQVIINYGTDNYSGYVFQDNWFESGQIIGNTNNSYSNCVIQNNIFYQGNTTNSSIYGLNSISVLIDHNLFYGAQPGPGVVFAGDCKGLLISNNIFVRRNAATQCSTSTFNNNITYLCGVDNPWTLNGNTGNINNVAGQDPQMASQAAINSGTNDPLLNFTIAGGPANNAGTDGKDMGLLFDPTGILNWTNSRMSRIPYVYSVTIANPNLPAGGTLSVQVEARKNN